MLEESLEIFRSIGAENLLLEMEARVVELLVFQREYAQALTRATDALDRASAIGSMKILRAILERLRGYALVQKGDLELAQSSLDESVRLAREANAEYELALTLQAKSRLETLAGRHDEAKTLVARCEEIFQRLGVVSTPEVPLSG